MTATHEFYMMRAAESAQEAEQATLDNVRERCRRAEAAWLQMAERIASGTAMREQLAREKSAAAMALES